MWPFKKKQKAWKPKYDLDYFVLGIYEAQKFKEKAKKEMPKKPIYTPSKIITHLI